MHKKANKAGLELVNKLGFDGINRLYVVERLSRHQIAEKFGVSECAIENACKKWKIPARTNAESQSVINEKRFTGFSKEQEQLVYGSLLGDACLAWQQTPSNKTGVFTEKYRLNFSHCEDQLSYLLHKKSILGNGVKKKELKVGTRISGNGSVMKFFSFSHTPTLKEVAKLCHNELHQKFVTEEWLEKIDWLGVAYWYQDDGTLGIDRRNNHRTVRFCTDSFCNVELVRLQQMLKRFGLNVLLNQQAKDQYRLVCSKTEEVDRFLENIEPYLIPSMRYKCREEGLKNEWNYVDNQL